MNNNCEICNIKFAHKGAFQTHVEKNEKHKLTRDNLRYKLRELSSDELLSKYDSDNIDDIINDLEGKIMTNVVINNREALQEAIHEIHNFLRNNGAGYGMNALKVFNLIYGLKKISDKNLLKKVGLSDKCHFNNLLKMVKSNKLINYIYDDILNEVNNSEVLKDFLFYEIPKNLKNDVAVFLVNKIEEISKIEKSENMQLSGKIYEYFIGRDESAISELGAYFTDRHITNYIYDNLLELTSLDNNNKVPTMIDPFGGSGGFTTGFIMFLNKNYNIDWKTELTKVNHYDINEDVIKSAALEFFCLTNELPDMTNNLGYKNAFTDEFNNKKYKLVITNPPYGGDKCKKSDKYEKNEKVIDLLQNKLEEVALNNYEKEKKLEKGSVIISQVIKKLNGKRTTKSKFTKLYTKDKDIITINSSKITVKKCNKQIEYLKYINKQEKDYQDEMKVKLIKCSKRINNLAKKYNLTGNDKEACSLILMMDLLEQNGRAIGVLKEGVFFDKKYRTLRKCLIEHFNVKKIVSVPSSEFENTKTKTSIIVFDRTEEKTSYIEFYNLDVNKYKKDKFIINDKGFIEISENEKDIYSVTDTLISTASRTELLENKIYSFNGKDYIKEKIQASEGYELVRLGDICEFKQKSKRKASFGKNTGKINFYTSSDKIKKCDIADYKEELILIGTGGNSCLHIDKQFSCSTDLLVFNTKINIKFIYYILKTFWNNLINNMNGSTINHVTKSMLNDFQISIPKNEKLMKKWVKKISKPYDLKLEKENELKELEQEIEYKINDICKNEDCDKVRLDDICIFLKKKNKYLASDGNKEGKYRFYTSSQNKILFRNDYEFKNKSILIGRGGTSSIHLTSYFSVSHDDVYVLNLKNNNNNMLEYIFNYFKINMNNISKQFKGSTIKHCSKNGLLKLKIKLPKDKSIIQNLQTKFNQVNQLKQEVKDYEKLFKKYIKELGTEAIKE